jgi:hypothetical protein
VRPRRASLALQPARYSVVVWEGDYSEGEQVEAELAFFAQHSTPRSTKTVSSTRLRAGSPA